MQKISPIYIRNKLVKCFINANKKFVKEQAKKKGKRVSDKENFSNPRKESFPKVMALLRHKCKSPKGSEEEIMKNIHKIMDLIKRLEE